MHELWRDLRLIHNRVEYLPILIHEVDMRRSRVVPEKNGMAALLLALDEAYIKAEAIPVHMQQGQTSTQQLKDNNEIPIVMVHTRQIDETITLNKPTEEEWRKTT